jgi:hypothetical protein
MEAAADRPEYDYRRHIFAVMVAEFPVCPVAVQGPRFSIIGGLSLHVFLSYARYN